jgi:hypothetical protein
MDVGAKLGILFLASVALVGAIWLLWARFIGFPSHDPTSSPSQLGDPSVNDPHFRGPNDPPHA